jgi:hypothetical protein
MEKSTAIEGLSMEQLRIGELLSRIIPLSHHDVEDILNEQSSSNRRFGDIALSMGLCKPEHILKAWLNQLETQTQRIDLDRVGVDVQATAFLAADKARQLQALPLRTLENELLVAVAHVTDANLVPTLESLTGKRVKLVLAEEAALGRAIERFYAVKKSA